MKVNDVEWVWMKANEGERIRMIVNENKWRRMKANESEKWKVYEGKWN